MKKIFIAILVLFQLSIGNVYATSCPGQTWEEITQIWSDLGRSYSLVGEYATDAEANAAVGGADSWAVVYIVRNGQCHSGKRFQKGSNPYIVALSSPIFETPADSDSDGIPDENDFYPDDNTPHMVRPVGYYTSDCTMTGPVVATMWETDRGDRYYTGAEPPESACYYQAIGYPWQTPEGGISDSDFDHSKENPGVTVSNNDPGEPPIGNDSQSQPGQTYDPNDTQEDINRKIVDNTAAAAANAARGNDYAKSLDRALNNLNRSVGSGVRATDELATQQRNHRSEDQAEAETAKGGWDSFVPSESYQGMTGELVAGTDYQEAEGLSDQSWLQTFVDSNPYKNALANSGFHIQNSVCEMTLELGGMGSHKLSICEFDQEFSQAGQLLLALCTLGGFIMLVWR